MKNDNYIYYRVAVKRGSPAHRGLEKEMIRRTGINSEATLLTQFVEELYHKLAPKGDEDIDLLSLPTRIAMLLNREGK